MTYHRQHPRFSRAIENLIANLRGVPENPSRARLRSPKTIGELLDNCVLNGRRTRHTQREKVIMKHWAEIVGHSELCHRCRPVRLTPDHKLVVTVADPVLRQEVQFRRRDMLDRLQRLEGCQTLKAVVLIAG